MATANFNLPLFESNSAVDLMGVYNAAMEALDTALKTIQDTANQAGTSVGSVTTIANQAKEAAEAAQSAASTAQSTAQAAQSTAQAAQSAVEPIKKNDSDEIFTVADLAGAKVTSGGYVYFEE